MAKPESEALQLKKLTLTAWARILYKQGKIDSAKLGRMITLIEKLKENTADTAVCG